MRFDAAAVVDTNVVVAGLLTRDSASSPAQILDGMLTHRFRFVLSVELLAEYRRVLLRERIARLHGLAEGEVDAILAAVAANAILQEPVAELAEAPPDSGDVHLWRLLAARQDLVLVTGDSALLHSPPSFAGALSPASFIALVH